MLEMFKEASQNSGWARLCLQNISAYMSGYPMAPFFDKIIIADIMTGKLKEISLFKVSHLLTNAV